MSRLSGEIKRIIYIALVLSFFATNLFALSYSSSNYTISMPRFVASGGAAGSANYTIDAVTIGNPISGIGSSANYTLDATHVRGVDLGAEPNTPILDPVITPTNIPLQAISGRKDTGTSIYVNGYEALPLDGETSWNYEIILDEGDNHLIITARNASGLESEPVYVMISLDTTPPLIVISNVLDGTIIFTDHITVEGTIDGTPFTQEEILVFGVNEIIIDAADEAGNAAQESIETYLAHEPPGPPGTTQ